MSIEIKYPNRFKKGISSWNKGISPSKESKEKMRLSHLGKKYSEETRNKMSLARIGNKSNTGRKLSEEHKLNISNSRNSPNKGKYFTKKCICKFCGKDFMSSNPNPIFCSKKCTAFGRPKNIGWKHTDDAKIKMSINRKGKLTGINNYQWKTDRTAIREKRRLRNRTEWIKWRKLVFERDNYTCMECGIKGGILNPHHIIPLRLNMDKIFDITNGITLCKSCHNKTLWIEEKFIDKYNNIIKNINR